jgi:hypothetical protein
LSSTSLTKARQNRPNAFCPAWSAFFISCLHFRSKILHLKFEKHSKQPQDSFLQRDLLGVTTAITPDYLREWLLRTLIPFNSEKKNQIAISGTLYFSSSRHAKRELISWEWYLHPYISYDQPE